MVRSERWRNRKRENDGVYYNGDTNDGGERGVQFVNSLYDPNAEVVG